MNEILKAIPVMFNQRKPVHAPPRIDITEMAIRRTNSQFEQAFIEVSRPAIMFEKINLPKQICSKNKK